jgi:hypothetical protein
MAGIRETGRILLSSGSGDVFATIGGMKLTTVANSELGSRRVW